MRWKSNRELIILLPLLKRKLILTAVFNITLTLLLVCSLAFGQLPGGNEDPLGYYNKLSNSGKSTSIALESSIDPDKYILGPGDKLEMFIWGEIELSFELVVSPEGYIFVPSIGSLHVSGSTISDAKKSLIERSRKAYQKVDVSLCLIGVRMMKASISGTVRNPGVYEVASIDRLSRLIFLADGLYNAEEEALTGKTNSASGVMNERKERIEQEAKPVFNEEFEPSLRKITITDLEGVTRIIDYLRYQRTGNIEYNPVLKGGDQVNVPRKDSQVGVIHIFGAVKIPGEYEYIINDHLSDLIEIAGGFQSSALLSEILILRFDGNDTKRIFADLSENSSSGGKFVLQADDRVFVRSKLSYRQKYHVEIRGEVNFPGTYPIEDNKTNLSEIIELCGGFTDRADIDNSQIFRLSFAETDDPEFERLINTPIGIMTNIEYEYFKSRMRIEIPQVVVDFGKLFNEDISSEDVILRDRDVIDIPIKSLNVNVTGLVLHPGLVRYKPGENYKYYIQQAGGFTWNANKDKIRLIKADNKVLIRLKSDTVIDVGDTIFIPEKKETNWWISLKDVLTVVSRLATILAVVISVSS
ncbi:SLBB domain-containing protein [bacterium]|nr:SLBB domain-containing protein [bacterium]